MTEILEAADLGREVRAARDAAGLSRAALAAETGVSAATIEKFENARAHDVGLSKALALCGGVGVRVSARRGEAGPGRVARRSPPLGTVLALFAMILGPLVAGAAAPLFTQSPEALALIRSTAFFVMSGSVGMVIGLLMAEVVFCLGLLLGWVGQGVLWHLNETRNGEAFSGFAARAAAGLHYPMLALTLAMGWQTASELRDFHTTTVAMTQGSPEALRVLGTALSAMGLLACAAAMSFSDRYAERGRWLSGNAAPDRPASVTA